MAVTEQTPFNQYTVSVALTTTFAYTFEIRSDSDLKVYLTPNGQDPNDATQILTLTTDYTVTSVGTPAGGNVVLNTGAAVGDIITIRGNTSIDQLDDFSVGGDLTSAALNDNFDKLTLIQRDIDEKENRTPRYFDTEEIAEVDRKLEKLPANHIWWMNGDASKIEAIELTDSGSSAILKAELASHAAADGASLIGMEGSLTVQNLIDQIASMYGVNRLAVNIPGTGAVQVPSGTSAQVPGTPVNGMMRYDTTTGKFRGYESGAWSDFIIGSAIDQSNIVYFGKHGNDANNGLSIEYAKLTFAAAKAAAGATDSIVCLDGGIYVENFNVATNYLFAPNITITGSLTITSGRALVNVIAPPAGTDAIIHTGGTAVGAQVIGSYISVDAGSSAILNSSENIRIDFGTIELAKSSKVVDGASTGEVYINCPRIFTNDATGGTAIIADVSGGAHVNITSQEILETLASTCALTLVSGSPVGATAVNLIANSINVTTTTNINANVTGQIAANTFSAISHTGVGALPTVLDVPAFSNVRYVSKGGDDKFSGLSKSHETKLTLASAIAAAASGSTISCDEYVTFTEDLTISKNISLYLPNATIEGTITTSGSVSVYIKAKKLLNTTSTLIDANGGDVYLDVDQAETTSGSIIDVAIGVNCYGRISDITSATATLFVARGTNKIDLNIDHIVTSGAATIASVLGGVNMSVNGGIINDTAGTSILVLGAPASSSTVTFNLCEIKNLGFLSNINSNVSCKVNSSSISGNLVQNGTALAVYYGGMSGQKFVTNAVIQGAVATDTDSDLADVLDTGITSFYGLMIVREKIDVVSGVFRLEGTTIATVDANAAFSTTFGNAGTYNVYYAAGEYHIENQVADDKNISCSFFGVID